MIPSCHTLLTLARGLNGYPDVCHGGMVATIIDEVMGISASVFGRREMEIARARGEEGDVRRPPAMTAELVVTYRRPVRTPQTVCVNVWPGVKEGRKIWMHADVVDKDGLVLASGKGLFVQLARASI
jgi:acyl-coenzyme A thioesterase PaaI-like protein